MTLAPAFLDDLRARVALSTVVARRVKLTRAGREMKGCCPFHNEKTPSFYVNDDKAFYHCFGCGEHGSVFDWMMKQEGLGFIDAVKALAAEAGMEMPEESPESRERAQAAAGLHDITAAAAAWFTEQLGSIGGAAARAYLDRRGIAADTARAFGLGFAPDSRSKLKVALAGLGTGNLIETGLLIAPDDDGEPYDRFRGRLIFPIRDPRGRVIGFGGRILGDGQPKYLNSPDTPLFYKGRTLYNLDRAAPPARKSQRLIVVEGYMDVIGLAQAGVVEAVAPLGTALTESQLGLLWRVVPEPILCFDGDAAGQRAATKAALRALPLLEPGKSLRFATLPPGKDPDDLVREAGAAAFEAVLAAAEPLIDRLWRGETEGIDATTPERRAALLAALDARAETIGHAELKKFYRAELRDRFYATVNKRPERAPWVKGGRTATVPSPGILKAARPNMGEAMVRQVLVALLLRPELADAAFERLSALTIADAANARLLGAIVDAVAADPHLTAPMLGLGLDRAGLRPVADAVLAGHRPGIGQLGFTRATTPFDEAAVQLASFLDALLATKRVGDAFSAAASHFRGSMADDDFAAVRRNHEARAELTDKDRVIGIVAENE